MTKSLSNRKGKNTFLRCAVWGVLLHTCSLLGAQSYWINQNHQFFNSEKLIYQPNTNFHTAIRNYEMRQSEELFDMDSLLYAGIKTWGGKQHIVRRFVNDNLLRWKTDDYDVSINPLFDFELGKESQEGKNTYVNTRGAMVNGTIGKRFAFYADFYENQSKFPNYLRQIVIDNQIVPGQGKAKRQNYDQTSEVFDYSSASGYVSFDAGKHFNLQLGHGKNFIGDGYRSMLLSDVASNYPYFKINTSFGKIKYMAMWASMSHIVKNNSNDYRYPVKYGAFHFLDWNLGKRLSLGMFEAVIWADYDERGVKRGFELEYANPFVFLRPVEYGIGSPDNMLLGLNAKYVMAQWVTVYGQFMFDEFKLDELTSDNDWWANKYAFQIGVKTFDLFGIENLRVQAEYNQARPYMYSHSDSISSYGHYNQPLAHPLGGNFKEGLVIVNYRCKRIYLRLQAVKAMYGKDVDDGSYGKDIFKSNNSRINDYGNVIGQGLKTDLEFADASASYLVNPRNNFNFTVGFRYRNEKNDQETLTSKFVYVGIRTSLRNLYYDF
ncbi:MAG: hypothetical protein QM786_13620 [Breznakibacter sp.]